MNENNMQRFEQSVPGSYCGVCEVIKVVIYVVIQILITHQTWERLVEPGMGYDWVILVSLTKIVCVGVGLGSCSIMAKFLDLAV